MSEINAILIGLIVIAAIMQPTEERLYAALLFALLAAIHYVVMYEVDGIAYYGSAALLDIAVIYFTARLAIISKVIREIQNICLASIVLNAIGWAMWMLYLEPHAYDAMFIALYSWALIILTRRESADVSGVDTMGGRRGHIHSVPSKSSHRSAKHEKTA